MSWRNNQNCVMVTGFAQLPKGTPLYELQKIIGCVLVIDQSTNMVIDASFTFIMELTSEFISSLIIGKTVENGIEEIGRAIEQRYIASEQRAIIQAVKSAYDRYCESIKCKV